MVLEPARDGHYTRSEAPSDRNDQVPAERVREFVAAVNAPPTPDLEPFLSEQFLDDDGPYLLVLIHLADGRLVEVTTNSQRDFMLPPRLDDTARGKSTTFDPGLSRALAGLMPDGFLLKERLARPNPGAWSDRGRRDRLRAT